MKLSSLILLVFLSACTPEIRYEEVRVPIDVMVPVPAELTSQVDRPVIDIEVWGDISLLAQAALRQLDLANYKLKQIEGLQE